jgi:hypothetical protein
MTIADDTSGLTVPGRIFLYRVDGGARSWMPLECGSCGERVGLTLTSDPVGYRCPRGHSLTDWRLTADAEVKLVGEDAEVRVVARGGRLESREWDEGDGEDDTRV